MRNYRISRKLTNWDCCSVAAVVFVCVCVVWVLYFWVVWAFVCHVLVKSVRFFVSVFVIVCKVEGSWWRYSTKSQSRREMLWAEMARWVKMLVMLLGQLHDGHTRAVVALIGVPQQWCTLTGMEWVLPWRDRCLKNCHVRPCIYYVSIVCVFCVYLCSPSWHQSSALIVNVPRMKENVAGCEAQFAVDKESRVFLSSRLGWVEHSISLAIINICINWPRWRG